MSTTDLRISLSEDFPFLYRDAERTVLVPDLDQIPRFQNWNQPRLLFAENVLPIQRGLLSVQFQDLIPGSEETDFDQAVILRDTNENATLFVPAKGKNYVLNISTGVWTSSLPFAPTHLLFTYGNTQGRSFVFYEKEKLFEYDGTTNSLVDRTASLVLPTGTTVADIRGIGAAGNYLLLFTEIEILWSNPSDPLNFDSSLNNGSGKQIPEDVRGAISCILPISGGAIIYTVRNAVAAYFTNNAATPFAFRGIDNSGGVANHNQVAAESQDTVQYVFGSGGIQRVSLAKAEGWSPELTDFLTSGRYEVWDYDNHEIVESHIANYFAVRTAIVSQRFLVISYGPTPDTYTYALIYDTLLQRWGKVKVDHVDCFSYPYPNISGDLSYEQLFVDYAGLGDASYADLGVGVLSTSPPKKSIAFLDNSGGVKILVADYSSRSEQGVAVIGQIQHNRGNFTTVHEVELEGVDGTSNPVVVALVSVDGKNLNRVDQYTPGETTNEYQLYYGSSTGKNVAIAVQAAFQLTGFLVRVAKGGKF